MSKHIVVNAANGSECVIFVDHITMIQQSIENDGAFIYFGEKSTVLTKESYPAVLKLLNIGGSTKIRSTTVVAPK
jgi:hypothetical protein